MKRLIVIIAFTVIFKFVQCQVPTNLLPQLSLLYPGMGQYSSALEWFKINGQQYLDGIDDSQCKQDLLEVYKSVLNREKWALQMVDAWAKPQAGLLSGNLMHLGNFDECIGIDHKTIKNAEIKGQYCTTFFVPTDPEIIHLLINVMLGEEYNRTKPYGELIYFMEGLKLSWGMCIPSSCTIEKLTAIYNYTQHYFDLDFYMSNLDEFCYYKGKLPLTNSAILGIVIFSLCILNVLIATFYDILTSGRKERNKVLIAFSALANGKRILSNSSPDNQMGCLNGMRVISMFWIILAHRLTFFYYAPHINGSATSEFKLEPENMILLSAPFAVDTFFVIGGLLVSYHFFQTRADGKEINIPMYYIHRILRLTPSLAAVVLFFATLVEYIGNGPLWPIVNHLYKTHCENNWWVTLLYIQNYLYSQEQCASQAWYLAVDTQLYFIAPILLFPLAKWPKRTMCFIVLLTLSSLASVFASTWILKLGSNYFDETTNSYKNYIATHTRASSWLVGFIMGYILLKLKNKKVTMKKSMVISLWFLSIGTTSAVVFGHISFTRNEYNMVKSVIFNTFSRPAWSLAVCWIIFACNKGYGGIVNKILSLPLFNVMIRINYNMYLVHMVTIIYFVVQEKTSTDFQIIQQVHASIGDISMTIVLAFLWTLLFESPVMVLEKVIFKKDESKRQKTTTNTGHIENLYEIPNQSNTKLHL